MLFNVKDDPYEQKNLKDTHPEICAKGAKLILDWQDELMACSESIIDPIWQVISEGDPYHARGNLDRYIQRLKDTNRGNHAAALEAKKSDKYY